MSSNLYCYLSVYSDLLRLLHSLLSILHILILILIPILILPLMKTQKLTSAIDWIEYRDAASPASSGAA